jgi:glycogen(starch) synthase
MREPRAGLSILFLAQEYARETGWGGIGSYIRTTARALSRRGHDVHVLSAVGGQTEGHYDERGIHVHRYGQWSCPPLDERIRYRFPLAWQRLRAALSNYLAYRRLGVRFDVIEAPEWMAEGLMFTFARRCPLVTHVHGSLSDILRVQGAPISRDARLAITLEGACVRRSDHVTGATRGALIQGAQCAHIPTRDVTVVPHPIDVSAASCAPASRTPPWVLFVGRLEPLKNPEVIARAAPLVLREVPAARFIFVGKEGGSLERLRAIIETERIAGSVELRGWLDPRELDTLRGQARVCVVPSRWESFGLVVTEAMAAGRPVIASCVCGMSEIVMDGDTGILADPENPAEWAGAIIRLLKDPALAGRMGDRARSHFSPEQAAATREDVYLRALSTWARRVVHGSSIRKRVDDAHPRAAGLVDAAMDDPYDALGPLMVACGARAISPRQFWREVDRAYHAAEAPVYEQAHRDMVRELPAKWKRLLSPLDAAGRRSLRWLDVGCGTGLVGTMMSALCGDRISQAVLIDPSPSMIARCRTAAASWPFGAGFVVGTVESLAARPAFDLITLNSVLHHVVELDAFCARISRLLRPGGYLITCQDPRTAARSDPVLRVRMLLGRCAGVSAGTVRYRVVGALPRSHPVVRLSRALRRRRGMEPVRASHGATPDPSPAAIVASLIDNTNAELLRRRVVRRPLSPREVWAVTDFHVPGQPGNIGRGIDLELLKRRLRPLQLDDHFTYGFFGCAGQAVPPRLASVEESLFQKSDPHGSMFATRWRKPSPDLCSAVGQ